MHPYRPVPKRKPALRLERTDRQLSWTGDLSPEEVIRKIQDQEVEPVLFWKKKIFTQETLFNTLVGLVLVGITLTVIVGTIYNLAVTRKQDKLLCSKTMPREYVLKVSPEKTVYRNGKEVRIIRCYTTNTTFTIEKQD